jgi:hypothetical protein
LAQQLAERHGVTGAIRPTTTANNNSLPEITQVLLTSQGKTHKSQVRNCSKKARHKISTFLCTYLKVIRWHSAFIIETEMKQNNKVELKQK